MVYISKQQLNMYDRKRTFNITRDKIKYIFLKYPISTEVFNSKTTLSNLKYKVHEILNVSRVILQLSLPNPLKPGVKSRMKM